MHVMQEIHIAERAEILNARPCHAVAESKLNLDNKDIENIGTFNGSPRI